MADGKVVYEIRGDNSKFQQDVNESERIAQGKMSAIGGFAKSAIVGIGAAVTAVGAGMVAFSKDAIDAGSQFDAAMSQVAATMGVTVDEIGNLRDFAMEMGSTTAFSANEAAQALNYMALAGYDAETSMSMLPNVLNLAAAGNMDLARASDMVTDAQSALGLSLEDTSLLVDKMAKASSKSNTSVEQLGDAMLTVGGTAKSLKGGTTELATMLGVLADNGIKGAEGGTALRNVILALSVPTDKAAKKLSELGVSAYDADGNMRALDDVFADLNAAMDGMTQGEKSDVLNTIFNKVDLKSANALLATSTERFDELSTAIDGATGAAEQMAGTQLDNLTGDITLMQSALEGAKITLSDSLTPTLRKFVQFGTKEIGKLDKAFKSGGIDGLATQLGKTLTNATKKLTAYIPTLVTIAGKFVSSFVSSFGKYLSGSAPKLVANGVKMLREFATNLISSIPDLLKGVGSAVGSILTNIPNLLSMANELVKNLASGIIQALPDVASSIWNGIKGMFSAPLDEDVAIARGKIAEMKTAMQEFRDDNAEMVNDINNVDVEYGVYDYWLEIYEDLKDKTDLTKQEQYKLKEAVEQLNGVLPDTDQIVQDETGHWVGNTQAIKDNIEAMKLRKKAEIYIEKSNDILAEMVELEIKIGEEQAILNEYTSQYNEELNKVNSSGLPTLRDEFGQFLDDVRNGNADVFDASDAIKAYATEAGLSIDRLKQTDIYGNVIFEDTAQALSNLEMAYNNLESEVITLEAPLGEIEDKIRAQKDVIATDTLAWDEMNNTVEGYIDKSTELKAAADAFKNAGRDTVNGYIAGFMERIPAAQAAASDLGGSVTRALRRSLEIASPSKKMRREIGQNVGKGVAVGMEDTIPDVEKESKKLSGAIDISIPDIPNVEADLHANDNNQFSAIIAVLNKYLPRIGAPIVLDTGELVGATVDKYDYELGVLQERRARYE